MKRFGYKLDALTPKQAVTDVISFRYRKMLFLKPLKLTLNARLSRKICITPR